MDRVLKVTGGAEFVTMGDQDDDYSATKKNRILVFIKMFSNKNSLLFTYKKTISLSYNFG